MSDNQPVNLMTPHHQTAFSILSSNPHLIVDDEPLDDLIESIAAALQDAFDLGFRAAGGSIHRIATGWCTRCGCGNNDLGFAHLKGCPTVTSQVCAKEQT
jgi:hypothetical protein